MQLILNPDMIACVTAEPALNELDDIEALDRIYRARLLRYVAYSVGDQDLAETIVQDCLLKAYNNRASFRGDCAVYTWLAHIATNLMRDQPHARPPAHPQVPVLTQGAADGARSERDVAIVGQRRKLTGAADDGARAGADGLRRA